MKKLNDEKFDCFFDEVDNENDMSVDLNGKADMYICVTIIEVLN